MMNCRGMGAVTKKAKGKKIPGKLKGYAQGTGISGYKPTNSWANDKFRMVTPNVKDQPLSDAARAAMREKAKQYEAASAAKQHLRFYESKTKGPNVRNTGGGGGMGIISGGAMARGMPTSGLPDKKGVITVEETGMKRGGKVKFKKKAKAKMVKRKMKGKSC